MCLTYSVKQNKFTLFRSYPKTLYWMFFFTSGYSMARQQNQILYLMFENNSYVQCFSGNNWISFPQFGDLSMNRKLMKTTSIPQGKIICRVSWESKDIHTVCKVFFSQTFSQIGLIHGKQNLQTQLCIVHINGFLLSLLWVLF